MAFNVPWRTKTIQILLTLSNGAKGIQEIQVAVGGSYTTIDKCLNELQKSGLLTEEQLSGEEYGETPKNKRWIKITPEGTRLIQSLLSSNFLKIPTLKKDRQKWIILMLHSLNTVVGKTRFMKLLFLLRRETGFWRGSFFKFWPYDYGPYSWEVEEDIKELERNDYITVRKTRIEEYEFSEDEKVLYTYTLTSKGKALAPELLAECPPNSMQKMEKMHALNRMPLLELLRYVYERYPKFIANSVIVEKVLGNREANQ